MKRLILALLYLSSLFAFGVQRIRAQEAPVWQTAETIRGALFQAQQEMYAAARADEPQTHYDTAVAHIQTAADHYGASFQPHFADDVNAAIATAFTSAETAAANGEAARLASVRGRIWTGLLWGSYLAAQDAVAANDADVARSWLSLREYRDSTRVSVVDDAAAQAVVALQAGDLTADAAQTAVANDLRDTYYFRLRDALNELETAVEKEFPTRAAEWAGQARGYFDILQDDFAAKQGDAAAQTVTASLTALETASIAGDWNTIGETLPPLRAGLGDYQPVPLSPAEVEKRAQLLYLFIDLVYIEYKDGVRDGQIVIPIEYQEAVTFRDQAETIYEELRPVITAKDPVASERLAALLAEMEAVMGELGEKQLVQDAVTEALTIVETTLGAQVDATDGAALFPAIYTLLDEVQRAADEGRYVEAERTRLEAYAMFESGPEQRLVHRAPRLSRSLEGQFWEGSGGEPGLAALLASEASPEEISVRITALKTGLGEAEQFLSAGLSGAFAALNSAVIIIREGLEAVLIVGAILGYLRATGETRKYTRWVYAGVAAALLLSLLTWWVAQSLITISVANRELIEGIASLIAVVVLFYVTNWLFHKVYVVDWMTFVKEQVGKALTTGSALALAGLGFTVVYREGFETVLFYQALLFDAEPLPVGVGFAAGGLFILIVAYVVLRYSKRLPLKQFFAVTGMLLLLLAFNFTGAGVRELQEAGVVPATLLLWMPENLVLMEVLGVFPTLETTLAQAFFLLAVAGTFGYSRWQGRAQKMKRSISAP